MLYMYSPVKDDGSVEDEVSGYFQVPVGQLDGILQKIGHIYHCGVVSSQGSLENKEKFKSRYHIPHCTVADQGFVTREGRESKCRDDAPGLKGPPPPPPRLWHISPLFLVHIYIVGYGYCPPTRPTSRVKSQKKKKKNGQKRWGGGGGEIHHCCIN